MGLDTAIGELERSIDASNRLQTISLLRQLVTQPNFVQDLNSHVAASGHSIHSDASYFLNYDLRNRQAAIAVLESAEKRGIMDGKISLRLSLLYAADGRVDESLSLLQQSQSIGDEYERLYCRTYAELQRDPVQAAARFHFDAMNLFSRSIPAGLEALFREKVVAEVHKRAVHALGDKLGIKRGANLFGDLLQASANQVDFDPMDYASYQQLDNGTKLLFHYSKQHSFEGRFASHLRAYAGKTVKQSPHFYELTQDVFAYDSSDRVGYEDIAGRLVFKTMKHDESYFSFMRFCESLVGDDTILAPMAIARTKDGFYDVMFQQGEDLEKVLGSQFVDPSVKYAALAKILIVHTDLQEKLSQTMSVTEQKVFVSVPAKWGLSAVDINYQILEQNLEEELMVGMILGRDTDVQQRLARSEARQFRVVDGKREYIGGSSTVLDTLISAAKNFIEQHLQIHTQIPQLLGLADRDSQPSNFIGNKVSDLERLEYGNVLVTPVRLLGHPASVDFLASLSPANSLNFFYAVMRSQVNPRVAEAVNFIEQHPCLVRDSDYLTAFYVARKLMNTNVSVDSTTVDNIYRSLDAYKAWVNARHAITYECTGNSTIARRYFSEALKLLDRSEFHEFRDAYVAAIRQSNLTNLKSMLS